MIHDSKLPTIGVAPEYTFSRLIEVVKVIQEARPDQSLKQLIEEMEKKREELLASTTPQKPQISAFNAWPKKRTEDERTYDHYWRLFFQAVLNKFGKDKSQRDQFPEALFHQCRFSDLVECYNEKVKKRDIPRSQETHEGRQVIRSDQTELFLKYRHFEAAYRSFTNGYERSEEKAAPLLKALIQIGEKEMAEGVANQVNIDLMDFIKKLEEQAK